MRHLCHAVFSPAGQGTSLEESCVPNTSSSLHLVVAFLLLVLVLCMG